MTTTPPQATQVYQLVIKATPEQIWDAITKPEFTTQYFYGSCVDSTFEPGTPYNSYTPDGSRHLIEGTVLEADPPRRLQHSWRPLYDPDTAAEPHSRVTWEIEAQPDGTCVLTVVHDELESSPTTAERVSGLGWMTVLSGLKTLVETGQPLSI